MLAREDDAPVYGAQIVVVLGARFLGPHAETAEREGGAVPGDRNTVLELRGVLRMNAAAVLDCLGDSLLRRHGRELGRVPPEQIPAEEHALAAREKAVVRIGDVADRKV